MIQLATKQSKILLIMFAPYRTVQMQIAALSAFLKRSGHDVRYLEIIIFSGDTFSKYKNAVEKELREFCPDLVGFSSYDMNHFFIVECANFIREVHPEAKIVVGGHHASLSPQDYMEHEAIDFVCVGEGEHVLGQLLEAMSDNLPIEPITGLCSRNGQGEVTYNAARALIENLDELPAVDRSIVESQQAQLNYLPVLAGKGCPYSCTYCANDAIKSLYPNANKYVRYRSPEKIIEEIEECRSLYKFDYVFFYDDIFALDFGWLRRFSELYVATFPDLPFHCLLRPEIAAKEKHIELLENSGCKYVYIGVESGSENYRKKFLNRNMSNRTILQGARLIRKHHVGLYIFMMVGLPGETVLDMAKSLWLNFRTGAEGVQTGIFYPIGKTALHKYCTENNLINEKRRRNMFVYTYDTCLNYSPPKRALIVLMKWLNSGLPVIRRFELSLVPHFFRIQHRRWFKRTVDYRNRIS